MECKICIDCKIEKQLEDFYTRKNRKHPYSSYCKSCTLLRNNKSRRNNPNTKVRSQRNWKDWSSKNDNLVRRKEYARSYYSNRSKTDPFYKLRLRLGSWILSTIKKNKGKKSGSIWEYLPYSPEELKNHIENQFEDWMNWDNHGNGNGFWNLDHIHPQSSLPYDSLEHPNFLKCWDLSNLRPISWEDNLIKSNKLP